MELSELGKTPISDDKPTGQDPSYEPEFEAMEAEIEKMISPSSTETADWNKVVRLASSILAEKSKDLRVASRLAVARIQLDKFDGFVDGVRLFADLIENFWDKLYPPKKRMRGRMGAIEWWLEKTEALLGQEEPAPTPAEKLDELKNELKRLDGLFIENLKDPPMLRSLERFVDSVPAIAQKAPEPEPEPVAEQKPETAEPQVEKPVEKPAEKKAAPELQPEPKPFAAAPPPTTSAVDASAVSSGQDAVKALRTELENVRRLGAFLRDSNLMDPLGYRCTRIAAWTLIETLPPAVEGSNTALPAPDPNFTASIQEMKNKGNYEALVKALEGRVSQYRFWMDLSCMSAETLLGMGPRYQGAYDAVCAETSKFIARVQGLEKLAFQDGTPFADANTKKWLKGLGGAGGMVETMSATASSSEKDKKMAEVFNSAKELVGQQKVAEALSSLQKELQSGGSGRERLLWRLNMCRLLIEAKKTRLAVPHLEKILAEIDRFDLEHWEPVLALDGLRVVWLGFSELADEKYQPRIEEALDRIAGLSPAAALGLAGL